MACSTRSASLPRPVRRYWSGPGIGRSCIPAPQKASAAGLAEINGEHLMGVDRNVHPFLYLKYDAIWPHLILLAQPHVAIL